MGGRVILRRGALEARLIRLIVIERRTARCGFHVGVAHLAEQMRELRFEVVKGCRCRPVFLEFQFGQVEIVGQRLHAFRHIDRLDVRYVVVDAGLLCFLILGRFLRRRLESGLRFGLVNLVRQRRLFDGGKLRRRFGGSRLSRCRPAPGA